MLRAGRACCRTWAASRDVTNVLAAGLLHSRGTTMPRSLRPARVHRATQGGWGPKHLGDSGRHQRAKQIAADIEECPKITRAYKWFDTASKLTQAKPPRNLPLARLVRDGNDHIRTVEAMVTPENACVFEERIRKWKALVAAWENHRRVAAGEAEVLPDAFTAAAAWFGTAKRSISTDVRTLGNLASVGNRHINAVLPLSSYPRGSRLTIAWRCLKWKYQISCWEVAALEASLHALRDARIWVKIRDTEKCLVRAKQYRDEACQRLEHFKPTWLKHRAEQRKKRTCTMCGKTAPNSSRAFDYCGGCQHSAVPRVDRPRYCSEECQRAHWLAGHMNECPSCTG